MNPQVMRSPMQNSLDGFVILGGVERCCELANLNPSPDTSCDSSTFYLKLY